MIGVRARERGLTLLELVVAVTVLALAVLVASDGLAVLGRAAERERRAAVAQDSEESALELFRSELGRALPLDWGVIEERRSAFVGTAERLRFVNAPPEYRAHGSLDLWEFALEEDGNGRRLVARRAPLVRDGTGFARLDEAEPVVLARFDRPLGFAYWGRPRDEREARWWPDWPPGERLPLAVRLGAEDGRPPATVVRLAIDWPRTCLGRRRGRGCE
ncbi:MAG: prepilin-type N-terminal cleavage/methylation domain-containing protein [Geminicoccaceae bacterium]|nr:prepilin-type N-terminal cleavage/methylation domain-containing protein [Geminicoccaceae bacterium]MCS7266849.1 prepilin-type N-terminal cleavage/methylation domain-containing protein [Geminicoccaceae bacterium]MCX7628887.1 prepilin-type N-terminal cleavage/methylation domain-containing protein [Geminicoccaceae bacterium]MDW8124228.1 prepilin-type N-terminal cleavage/methylation domain-containing protein [Geminicoccaceae bacterium]MDW8340549.1 prepilin-type N-terminal cleavage/methylation do